jgi:rubrerythrin
VTDLFGTRELRMKDVEVDPDQESPYECFACGKILTAADAPSLCPDCGGAMRNRQVPFE